MVDYLTTLHEPDVFLRYPCIWLLKQFSLQTITDLSPFYLFEEWKRLLWDYPNKYFDYQGHSHSNLFCDCACAMQKIVCLLSILVCLWGAFRHVSKQIFVIMILLHFLICLVYVLFSLRHFIPIILNLLNEIFKPIF